MNSIYLDGRALPWKVQPSPRLKKIHISVHPQEGIILRTPLGCTAPELDGLLAKNREWLVARIEELSRRCPTREYGDGQILPYLGGEVVLRLHPGHGRTQGRWQGDQVDIFIEPGEQTRDRVRECLGRLYLARARQWFPPGWPSSTACTFSTSSIALLSRGKPPSWAVAPAGVISILPGGCCWLLCRW